MVRRTFTSGDCVLLLGLQKAGSGDGGLEVLLSQLPPMTAQQGL